MRSLKNWRGGFAAAAVAVMATLFGSYPVFEDSRNCARFADAMLLKKRFLFRNNKGLDPKVRPIPFSRPVRSCMPYSPIDFPICCHPVPTTVLLLCTSPQSPTIRLSVAFPILSIVTPSRLLANMCRKAWTGLWRSPFVLQTFAHHFHFVQGSVEVTNLPFEQCGPRGALALACAAVSL